MLDSLSLNEETQGHSVEVKQKEGCMKDLPGYIVPCLCSIPLLSLVPTGQDRLHQRCVSKTNGQHLMT